MNNFLLNWDGDIWNIPKSNSKTQHLIFFSFDIKLSHYWKNNNKDLFTNLIIFILGKTGFTNVEIVGKLIQTSSGLVIGTRKPRFKSSLLQNLKKCKRPYFSSQYFLKYLITSGNILRNLEVSWHFLRYFEMRNIKFSRNE